MATDRGLLESSGGPEPDDLADARSRSEAASLWTGMLFGKAVGYVVGAIGHGGHYKGASYKFTEFEPIGAVWPGQGEEFLAELLKIAETTDTFLCPLLRDKPGRNQRWTRALPGRYAWMDADNWNADNQTDLQQSGVLSKQVDSGCGTGGRHIYVDLGEPLAASEIVGINKRLQTKFGTDTHGGDNKLLRPPGTWNHKPKARGQQSLPVRWLP